MSQEQSTLQKYIPHLIILSVLLVIEYWAFMTQISSFTLSGDYGPILGIISMVGLVLFTIIVLGFYTIISDSDKYKLMVKLSLFVFLIQMFLLFIGYVFIATNM
ncbi:MAG: membrane protein of unknown function [Candidatus Thorarchaeota archaeon]|nr:MAG: membrane protein of unknown function [Candidatus Thorarchaeota archaeon]